MKDKEILSEDATEYTDRVNSDMSIGKQPKVQKLEIPDDKVAIQMIIDENNKMYQIVAPEEFGIYEVTPHHRNYVSIVGDRMVISSKAEGNNLQVIWTGNPNEEEQPSDIINW